MYVLLIFQLLVLTSANDASDASSPTSTQLLQWNTYSWVPLDMALYSWREIPVMKNNYYRQLHITVIFAKVFL